LRVRNGDTCIGRSCCHWSAVIARIDAIHPRAIAIEPAISKAGGGGEGRASNGGFDDAAVVAVVIEVGIDQHVHVGDAVLADLERYECTNTCLVRGPAPWSAPWNP